MKYALFLKKSAEKELLSLPRDEAFKIRDAIIALGDAPRPSGCKKLSVKTDEYRIRIGSYRVVYTISDKKLTVWVIKIAHRKDAYQ